MSTPIRIVIADDHPFFRDGLRVLFETTPDTDLVGEAENGDQALDLTRTHQPDVVVMDLRMPGTDGITATRHIVEQHPDTAVLVVSMVEDDEAILAAIRAGARGYLLKGADREDTLLAIRAASRGDAVFGAGVATRLAGYLTEQQRPSQLDAVRDAFPDLTDRERQVLQLVARGRTNQQISDELHLTLKTVRNYVSNILTKLHVATRGQVIVRARDAGLR